MSLSTLPVRRGTVAGWACLTVGAIVALIQPAYAGDLSPAGTEAADRSTLITAANEVLGLDACDIATLNLERPAPPSLAVEVPIGGTLHTLRLARQSVRSPHYELRVQRADGSYETVEPGPVRTYRGTVEGAEGARVAASMLDDGLHAVILIPDAGRYWIEPIASRVAAADRTQHAVYHDDAVPPAGSVCGVMDAFDAEEADPAWQGRAELEPSGYPDQVDHTASTQNDTWFAELGVDTDVEFFLENGSVEATEAQIDAIVNTINIQYERDVGIQHTITHLIVRTAEPDPYSSRSASTLLDQFRNHWLASQSGVVRDVALLLSGKELYNSVAGISYFTGICSAVEGYSMTSSKAPYCGLMACRTDLVAHELGHNWGTGHCNCPGWTMHPFIQSANRFHADYSIPDIVAYRNSRTCLFQGDELAGVDVLADATEVAEGNTVQLAATAMFLYGRDLDVTLEASWEVTPPEFAWVDSDGVFQALDVEGEEIVTVSAAYTFDGVERVGEVEFTVVDSLAAPSPDPIYPDKIRFISMSVPEEASRSAIRVVLTSLHHPVPENVSASPAPDFTFFEGYVRWVGPVNLCTDRVDPPSEYRCAQLACDPYYSDDWGPGVIHLTGAEIIPSSTYDLEIIPASCEGNEVDCPFVSESFRVRTQRWGDIVEPFQVPSGAPGTASQPDVLDIATAVDALRETPNAPPKMMVQTRPNAVDPTAPLSVLDIALIVDAVKGYAYAEWGPCGCPTPPWYPCPSTDYCGRCVP